MPVQQPSTSVSDPLTPSTFPLNTQPHYDYEPLPDAGNYLRLVSLRQEHGSVLSGTLQHYSINSLPDYCALSYEWGKPGYYRWILLDQCNFKVQVSLNTFLGSILKSSPELNGCLFFIDAVCVDQSNVQERNLQVTLMKFIYKTARLVLCWLGPAANGSDEVFELLQAQYDRASDRKIQELYLQIHISQRRRWILKSLLDLLQRTYWQRLWIVQEVLLAKRIVLYCGNKILAWKAFNFTAMTHLRDLSLAIKEPQDGADPNSVDASTRDLASSLDAELEDGRVANFGQRRREWGDEQDLNYGRPVANLKDHRFDLRSAIITFGNSSCSDPRDRVYGLLGAATKESDKGAFPVNYEQNVIGLFFDTVDYNLFLTLSMTFACTLSRHLDLRPHVCSEESGRLSAKVKNSIPAKFRDARFNVSLPAPCELHGRIMPSEVLGLADEGTEGTFAASSMSIWSLRTRGEDKPGGQAGSVCFTMVKARPGDVVFGVDSSHCAMLARKSTLRRCFPVPTTSEYQFVGRCLLTHPTRAGNFSMRYAKMFLEKRLPYCRDIAVKPSKLLSDPWAKEISISAEDLLITATDFAIY